MTNYMTTEFIPDDAFPGNYFVLKRQFINEVQRFTSLWYRHARDSKATKVNDVSPDFADTLSALGRMSARERAKRTTSYDEPA